MSVSVSEQLWERRTPGPWWLITGAKFISSIPGYCCCCWPASSILFVRRRGSAQTSSSA
ncbi:Hypothetical predicted protein [Scomber scombrus]|uniref:Uncharacterized protein n=1 Tax=Scomber scombrus TaxID=13677 RepID=A0AAV1PQ93_SCOSC